jgi:TatA/E family protein of Tat protein translocase
VLLFGSSKLPRLAKSMGQIIKEFIVGMREAQAEDINKPALEAEA